MAYLYALVAVFGVLTLLNLLLTFGVIRRLRRSATTGAVIGDFTADDLHGRPVSNVELAGRTLVGFFSPGCDACRDRLADFAAAARSQRALAVVTGDAASASEYLPSLAPVSRVVLQEPDGPLVRAFPVTSFPSFFVVDSGRVVAGSATVEDLLISVAA